MLKVAFLQRERKRRNDGTEGGVESRRVVDVKIIEGIGRTLEIFQEAEFHLNFK